MKKKSSSLPTMIGVAEGESTARALAKALSLAPGCHEDFVATSQVALVIDGQDRVFTMNDAQSVTNIINEVTNNA